MRCRRGSLMMAKDREGLQEVLGCKKSFGPWPSSAVMGNLTSSDFFFCAGVDSRRPGHTRKKSNSCTSKLERTAQRRKEHACVPDVAYTNHQRTTQARTEGCADGRLGSLRATFAGLLSHHITKVTRLIPGSSPPVNTLQQSHGHTGTRRILPRLPGDPKEASARSRF